jgi:ATP synthase protein I
VTPWREYGRYGSVGIELLVSIALGYYGGRWVDGRVGAGGWITFLGFLFGVAVGFRSIFATARYMQRDIEREERRARGDDPWSSPTAGSPDETPARDAPPPRDPDDDRGKP